MPLAEDRAQDHPFGPTLSITRAVPTPPITYKLAAHLTSGPLPGLWLLSGVLFSLLTMSAPGSHMLGHKYHFQRWAPTLHPLTTAVPTRGSSLVHSRGQETCLSCFHQYLWHSEKFCVHSKCSVNVCWVNERMTRQLSQGSSLDLWISTCPDSILQLWCGRESIHSAPDPSSSSAHPSLSCTQQKGVPLPGL